MFDIFLLAFSSQIQQSDSVYYKLLLDSQIKCTSCRKAWRMIHFYQPWLQICIHHNIKSQDLEAQLVLYIVGLAAPV